jgi:hypothetical protein
VSDGEYSKSASWDGMNVPDCWLYSINVNGEKKKLLYLEADATSGGESALSLQQHVNAGTDWTNDTLCTKETTKRSYRRMLGDKIMSASPKEEDLVSTAYFDLDLKEVAQGFRRLTDLATCNKNNEVEVRRVLLVDPTVVIESGGGRQNTVREYVQELGLADVIVDARGLVLNSILCWLQNTYRDNDEDQRASSRKVDLKPVILETPSKQWFHSIRSELRLHGYEVIDRAQAVSDDSNKRVPPMLVYERSSADTVNTIRQYLDRGILNDPSKVCALLTCHDGLQQVESLNKSLDTPVGYICSSDIHEKALDWVRTQSVNGVPASKIQEQLDASAA